MARFEWIGDRVPEGMRITQVYGIILDREGRVMLRLEKTAGGIRYSLGGGRPEPFDDGIEATCRRELLEEVNTEHVHWTAKGIKGFEKKPAIILAKEQK